jgi:hypothetical protein
VLRLLFVTVTMVLLGLGTGYFLWGQRVARLTESLNGLTLEVDTMRERLARPQEPQGGPRAADELRVINESIAAVRAELAEQKAMIERNVAAPAVDVAEAQAELTKLRNELATCIADKNDFEMRCGGIKPPAPPRFDDPMAAPRRPTSPPPLSAPVNPAPPTSRPPLGNDLGDPRF